MSWCRYLLIFCSVLLFGCTQTSSQNGGQPHREPSPASVNQGSPLGNPSPSSTDPLPATEKPEPQIERPPVTSTEEAEPSNQPSPIEHPLPEAEPLMLVEEEQEGEPERMADNSRCLVCHLNYEREDISLIHAKAGYGCAHCHGPSDAHIADESWASGGNGTAPDIMYRPNEIIPACLKCHEHSLSNPECPCAFPKLPEKKSCTECHGSHRLKSRKCHWK